MEKLKQKESEFSYREDIQMTAEKALYSNCLSADFFHLIPKGAKYPMLAISILSGGTALNSQEYTMKHGNETVRIEYVEEVRELPHDQVIDREKHTAISPYSFLKERAFLLSTLPTSVRKYGYSVPDTVVAKNAAEFIGAMERRGIMCPKEEDVFPSSFGTIVIDVYNSRGVVSLEIGHRTIGFFTDYSDGINEESDGLASDFKSIPYALLKHLL